MTGGNQPIPAPPGFMDQGTGQSFAGEGNQGGGSSGSILALLQLAGMIYNSYQQRKNVKDTIAANKYLAEYQYEKDLEMWNRMNEYNSPLSQMARFQEAGLNPNLMYSQGGPGNASGAPSYNRPDVDYRQMPPWVQIPQALEMYQNFQLRQAQINNLNSRSGLTEQQLLLSQDQGAYQTAVIGNKARASEAKLLQEWARVNLLSQEQQQRELEMSYTRRKMTALDIQTEGRVADNLFKQYRNQWMAAGITTGDHFLVRMMVRMMAEAGLNIGQAFK